MAITGTFQADFESFYAAVQQADVELRSFETGAGKVETALNRMVDNFSGRKVIQDATLMAEAFDRLRAEGITPTDAELQRMGTVATEAVAKLRAIGQDIPPKIQELAAASKQVSGSFGDLKSVALDLAGSLGLVFSIGAVANWGRQLVSSVVESAGALVDMTDKTGISIEQLQRFAFVGKQANVTMEDFSQAAFKLGANLAGGSGSVRASVRDLGLDFEALRNQNPEDQFNAIIGALERMVNPQEKNRAGIELFGKTFAQIAPAVAKGYTEMAKQAQVSSAAQIKAIDDANDAFDRWVSKQKTRITSALGDLLLYQAALAKVPEEQRQFLLDTLGATGTMEAFQQAMIRLAAAADRQLPPMKQAAEITTDYREALAKATSEINALTPAQLANIEAALKLGEAHDRIATSLHVSDQALALYIERNKQSAEVLQQIRKLETDVDQARTQGILGLNAIEQQESQKRFEAHVKAIDEIEKAEQALRDFEDESALSTTDFQVKKIWEKAAEEIKAFKGTTTEQQQFNTAILTLASERAQDLYNKDAEYAAKTIKNFKDLSAAEAAATLTNAQWLDYLIDRQNAAREGQDKLTNSLREMAGVLSGEVASAFAGYAEQLDKLALTPGSSLGFAKGPLVASTITLPARAFGGPVSAGGTYVVGERGPELFTAGTSGYISPGGPGGGTTIVLMMDGREVSRVVRNDLVRRSNVRQGTA